MRSFLKFAAWVLGIVGVVVGVMMTFFVTLVNIGDDSMAPTALAGEQVLLWRDADAEMGDFVVCEHPGQPGTMVMGRVIATAGMQVGVRRGGLIVNGHTFDRDWQGSFQFEDPTAGARIRVKFGTESLPGADHRFMVRENYLFNHRETIVRGGQLYLLSDYWSMVGYDSRAYGPVVEATCIGQIFMRYKPIPDFEAGPPLDHGWLEFIDSSH